jgi:hypothetical protein
LLSYNTLYYQKIIAYDDHSNFTEGPVWQFTRAEFIMGYHCPERPAIAYEMNAIKKTPPGGELFS